jgi:hypothetical protein
MCELLKPHWELSPTLCPQEREKKEREHSHTPIFEVSPAFSPQSSPNIAKGRITERPCMHCGAIRMDLCA